MENLNRKSLIISADDFGVSQKANDAILSLANQGKLDRVAIMIGGSISSEDIKVLVNLGIKLDIHLHLFNNNHFSRREKEPSRGAMGRILYFLFNYLSGRCSGKKVAKIWEKQILDFKEMFGRYPDGLNSHEHIHFFPPFFRITRELSEELSIPHIRLGRKGIRSGNSINLILGILRKYNFWLSSQAFLTSEHTVGFDWLKNPDLQKIAPGTELVFHPERDEEYDYILKNL